MPLVPCCAAIEPHVMGENMSGYSALLNLKAVAAAIRREQPQIAVHTGNDCPGPRQKQTSPW